MMILKILKDELRTVCDIQDEKERDLMKRECVFQQLSKITTDLMSFKIQVIPAKRIIGEFSEAFGL
jgi:hypothetical protein